MSGYECLDLNVQKFRLFGKFVWDFSANNDINTRFALGLNQYGGLTLISIHK